MPLVLKDATTTCPPWHGEEGGDNEDAVHDMDLVVGVNNYLLVKFVCDSFSLTLTLPGISTKIVILNLFLGLLSVYNNVLDCCITVKAEDIASTLTCCHQGSSARRFGRTITPIERTILFLVKDYFNMDLEWYFGGNTPHGVEDHCGSGDDHNG
jgi:hypothetical protein